LYEVDGLNKVYNLGEIGENTTIKFKERFDELKNYFQSNEIMFNIMSIVKDDYKDLLDEKEKIRKNITGLSMISMEKGIELDIDEDIID